VRVSLFFLILNANKRSLTLNLKTDVGKDLFRKVIAQSDVLVEDFGPGALDRLGFGYAALANPRPDITVVQNGQPPTSAGDLAAHREAPGPSQLPDAGTSAKWPAFGWWLFAVVTALALAVFLSLSFCSWRHQPSTIHSLAVLPLESLSNEASQDYFAAANNVNQYVIGAGYVDDCFVMAANYVTSFNYAAGTAPPVLSHAYMLTIHTSLFPTM